MPEPESDSDSESEPELFVVYTESASKNGQVDSPHEVLMVVPDCRRDFAVDVYPDARVWHIQDYIWCYGIDTGHNNRTLRWQLDNYDDLAETLEENNVESDALDAIQDIQDSVVASDVHAIC